MLDTVSDEKNTVNDFSIQVCFDRRPVNLMLFCRYGVQSNLSWCSLTCHGEVQLVMVHSDLSWGSTLVPHHGAVKLVIVKSILSWGITAVQLVMVQFNLSWSSQTCHGEVQLVMVHPTFHGAVP